MIIFGSFQLNDREFEYERELFAAGGARSPQLPLHVPRPAALAELLLRALARDRALAERSQRPLALLHGRVCQQHARNWHW